uniref:Uncharacterized protein n=1 Tax=Biomphalaria glabrata TaxID=6526 RepID=A0A2C9LHR4_BIOGL
MKCNDLDAYSTFEELYAYSSKLCGSKGKNVENQKQNKPKNLDNDVYVNSHYATGIQNTRVKDANIQKINNEQAISMKTTSPIQLKRVVINDTQYTLVNKEGNNIKMQDNQGNNCDLDIIQTESATSLTSTRNNSQTRLKRVYFNNTDYTLVDKPQKDGLVHILKDNKKPTSTDTSWSKSVNSEAITSHNRKKTSNVRKPCML